MAPKNVIIKYYNIGILLFIIIRFVLPAFIQFEINLSLNGF